jgi:hypothetical protein
MCSFELSDGLFVYPALIKMKGKEKHVKDDE